LIINLYSSIFNLFSPFSFHPRIYIIKPFQPMKRILLILILAGGSLPLAAQTLLYPGDVALVNVNADGDKNFDVLLLKEIAAGTVIYFTDDAWINATQQFRGSEGIMSYTASSGMPAGSVLSCPGINGGNGFAKVSGSFNPSGSGDNIILYQGSVDDPFFLYGTGWARGSTVWEYSESSASYRSDIPPGLSISDYTIASLGTDDNYRYNSYSVTTGTLDELLSSIATPANWNADNTTPFSAISYGFSVMPDISTISTPSTISTLTPHHTSLHLTSSLTISGSVTCQSITIAPGGSLKILPGSLLRVFGEIDNQAGIHGLIIHSDATGSGSLIHSTPGVQGLVERYIGPDQWHFVSSPVSDPGEINALFGTTADHLSGIYYYDETLGEWASAVGSIMNPDRGYNVYYFDEGRTVTFHGILNDHRLRSWFPLTRGSGGGWNLVGNPFPCSLSWGAANQADAPGWKNQAAALDNKTIYITTGGSGESTTFDTYNGSSGIGAPDNTTGTIAPGQAFWVRAAASDSLGVGCYAKSQTEGKFKSKDLRIKTKDLSEKNQDIRHEAISQGTVIPPEAETVSPYAPKPLCPDALMSVYRFSVTSPFSGQSDQVVVALDERAERGLDRFDSKKMLSTGNNFLQWYINVDETPMVIVALPFTSPAGYSQPDTLPLTVILPDGGNYEITTESSTSSTSSTISTDNLNSVSFSFILEDRLTGVRQILRPDQPYAFSAGAGVLEGRFILLLSGNVEEVEEVEKVEEVEVVYSQGLLYVKSSLDLMLYPAYFRLFDNQGRCVLSSSLSEVYQSFSVPDQIVGIYFWMVVADNSNYTGKIFIIR
jgi:hypothetical protein